MEELIDILDSKGNYTGKKALKSEAHKNGWFHPTIHVWLYTKNGEVLMQLRSHQKKTFPNFWDVSVAGHVAAGEPILKAAIREVKEEIGLDLDSSEMQKIGIYKSVTFHSHQITDSEFHHTFLCLLQVPLESLTKQKGEVDDLALIPLVEIKNLGKGNSIIKNAVPHPKTYYTAIHENIKEVIVQRQ